MRTITTNIIATAIAIAGCSLDATTEAVDTDVADTDTDAEGTESSGTRVPPRQAGGTTDASTGSAASSSSSSGAPDEGSTGEPVGGSSTGDDPSTSTTTGGEPNWFAPCYLHAECQGGLYCVADDEGRGMCSIWGCEDRQDCPPEPEPNTEVRCTLGQLQMGAICALNCSSGFSCPDGLICVDTSYEGVPVEGVCVAP